jgi:hypothetical protein
VGSLVLNNRHIRLLAAVAAVSILVSSWEVFNLSELLING